MNTWFTADPHLGHKRILELAKRPFRDVDHMNETIVWNINLRVQPGDDLYILGDFAFADHDPFLARLNGNKHLIIGNHDHSKRLKKATLWSSVEMMSRIKIDDTYIMLCHYRMATWYKSHRGALHLYGHSHGNWPGDTQCCDVGVDCWNFRPVNLSEARKRMNTQPKRVEVDHHRPNEE